LGKTGVYQGEAEMERKIEAQIAQIEKEDFVVIVKGLDKHELLEFLQSLPDWLLMNEKVEIDCQKVSSSFSSSSPAWVH